jgi:hypothetical protein
MENKSVTAVEWLVNNIRQLESACYNTDEPLDILQEKAKEMEKLQIIDAVKHGESGYSKGSEQYYNKTFK